MTKTLSFNWDFNRLNDNRLKLLGLEDLLEKKGQKISSCNGGITWIHKGYRWVSATQKYCNEWNDGKTGNWTYIHVSKIK